MQSPPVSGKSTGQDETAWTSAPDPRGTTHRCLLDVAQMCATCGEEVAGTVALLPEHTC